MDVSLSHDPGSRAQGNSWSAFLNSAFLRGSVSPQPEMSITPERRFTMTRINHLPPYPWGIKKLTPSKAIALICRMCKNNQRFKCETVNCPLHPSWKGKKSNLSRIREFCLSCAGGQKAVNNCGGEMVLTPHPHKCPFLEYRLGHNPARRGIGRIENLSKGKTDGEGKGKQS